MKNLKAGISIFLIFSLYILTPLYGQNTTLSFKVEVPRVALKGIDFKVQVQPQIPFYLVNQGKKVPIEIRDLRNQKIILMDSIDVSPKGEIIPSTFTLQFSEGGRHPIQVRINSETQDLTIRAIPAYFSILPPLLAILLALITHQVIIALFFGIFLGVYFLYDFSLLQGFLRTLDTYLVQAVATPDHVSILMFTLVLGGMVGVISRSGGTQGIVNALARYARGSRGGQLATWAMGILIFFDDYANTLIVGNTMRPLTDKLKISREKLSYLVDSTAAPVANIAIISTWIGYEVSLIDQSLRSMNVSGNAYLIFIQTIPYNFYPIFALIFGFFIGFLLRDFGPMRTAELRARREGKVLRDDAVPLADFSTSEIKADESIPKRWYNALIPIAMVILVVSVGLIYTGLESLSQQGINWRGLPLVRQLGLIVGNADSFAVLMWGAFMGSITAIVMAVSQKLLSLQSALESWVAGIRSMMMAALILTLAWGIGNICQELFTADYMVYLTQSFLTPHWLPLVTFLTAGAISFATGTSWGTMAILMPIAIPLAHKFPLTDPSIDAAHALGLLLSTTAAVLAGSTWGDHCSPISDTTIMSSLASGSDHIDHVRTQLPYALVVATIASLIGYIPVGFGWNNWLVLIFGAITVFLVVRFVGKPITE